MHRPPSGGKEYEKHNPWLWHMKIILYIVDSINRYYKILCF